MAAGKRRRETAFENAKGALLLVFAAFAAHLRALKMRVFRKRALLW
jgi:hypothetical protein